MLNWVSTDCVKYVYLLDGLKIEWFNCVQNERKYSHVYYLV
jgi:hypothetical protein